MCVHILHNLSVLYLYSLLLFSILGGWNINPMAQ